MNLLCNNSQRRRDLDSLCQAHLCLGSPVCLGVASARNIWNAIIVECTNLVLPPWLGTGRLPQVKGQLRCACAKNLENFFVPEK